LRSRFFASLLIGLLVVAPFAVPISAGTTDAIRTANFFYGYDVDSSSVTYCRVEGANGAVWDPAPIPNSIKIKTTGSQNTPTAVTASSAPFALISVGDILVSANSNQFAPDVVVVIVKTDNDNVTVSSNVNWSTDAQGNTGRTFGWYKNRCGTAATDGWIDVSAGTIKRFNVKLEQGDIDGLDWRIECKGSELDAQPEVVYPGTATTCGPAGASTVTGGYCRFANAVKATSDGRASVRDETPWAACRIGVKFQSTDASETTTALERVSGSVTLARQ
jgi:hypothetical protein